MKQRKPLGLDNVKVPTTNKTSPIQDAAAIAEQRAREPLTRRKDLDLNPFQKAVEEARYIYHTRQRSKDMNPVPRVPIKFKKLNPEAIIPTYQTPLAAGVDLHAIEDTELVLGEFKLVKTGLSVELPAGFEMQIRPRSGLSLKHGITITNSPGTIDADYRGEIGIILHNLGPNDFKIKKGDRIAQAVIHALPPVEIMEVEELSDTQRGAGGFGHTGS